MSETDYGIDYRPLEVSVSLRDHQITLAGDLDESPASQRTLKENLVVVRETDGVWTVEAAGARVLPSGAVMWGLMVTQYLRDVALKYHSSQLATILSYDDEYLAAHPRSKFLDHWERGKTSRPDRPTQLW